MASAKKTTSKESAAKKAPAKKTVAKKTPAKKAPAKKTVAKKAAVAKKTPAKKAPAKKTVAKKTAAARKSPASKPPATRKSQATVTNARPDTTETFDQAFLDQQRQMLLDERNRYVKSAESLKAEADSLIEGREPGDVQFDEEGGEGDTLAVERERDLALSAHARAAVDEIDAALARLDNGTYGICVISGLPIPRERLEAIPWAAERVEYKAGGFRSRR